MPSAETVSCESSRSSQSLDPCDYLVIGAGAASMAFVDTLLTEQPEVKVIMVDKHPAPGGHWNDAYEFVRLHQPSIVYGVSSKQLEGNWAKTIALERTLPWKHRATKTQILDYYKDLVEQWVEKGQMRYFPRCRYDFSRHPPRSDEEKKSDEDCGMDLSFLSLDGKITYNVNVRVKIVNGVLGECKVPSQCPLEFPVDDEIQIATPNDLYFSHMKEQQQSKNGSGLLCHIPSFKKNPVQPKKYVVLGCGKTGMDTVVYLQTKMNVSPDNITWIIPNDVWMLNRDGNGGPTAYAQALLRNDGDPEKACDDLEQQGVFVRLDTNVRPTRFRFPVIGTDELDLMRKVKNVVRRGRVTSITNDAANGATIISFGNDQTSLNLPSSEEDILFVHCTSPGPFNGTRIDDLFPSEKEMNLYALFAPPVTTSLSCLAKLESARRKGTLDLDFGRKLVSASGTTTIDEKDLSENDVLRLLIRGYYPGASTRGQLEPLKTLAIFLSLQSNDPMQGLSWLKKNRLSPMSIPGFKCNVCTNMSSMVAKKRELDVRDCDVKMLELMQSRLKELEGM